MKHGSSVRSFGWFATLLLSDKFLCCGVSGIACEGQACERGEVYGKGKGLEGMPGRGQPQKMEGLRPGLEEDRLRRIQAWKRTEEYRL